MPIADKKIAVFAKDVSDLADKPNQGGGMTAAQVKAQFDAAPEELRVAYNGLIDLLLGVAAGDSGAHNIGSASIDGVTGATIYEQLVSLKQSVNDAVVGTIPDGSITPIKLAETAKAAQNVSVADMDAHFTSENVEGVLRELFTFANDGKTQVATAVTAKGVTASPADTFSSLATKIGQIATGTLIVSGDFLLGSAAVTKNNSTTTFNTVQTITINFKGTYKLIVKAFTADTSFATYFKVDKNSAGTVTNVIADYRITATVQTDHIFTLDCQQGDVFTIYLKGNPNSMATYKGFDVKANPSGYTSFVTSV